MSTKSTKPMHCVATKVFVCSVMALVVQFACCIQCLAQVNEAYEKKLNELERLVIKLPNDYIGHLADLNDSQLRELRETERKAEVTRVERIKSEPGIGVMLIDLVDRYLAVHHEGIISIFEAMSFRNDIPEADVRRFARKAILILNSKDIKSDISNDDFLIGIARYAKVKWDPELEGIMIKMLEVRDTFLGIEFKLAAAEALAVTGTAHSVVPMEKAVKWMANFAKGSTNGASNEQAKKLREELQVLQSRVKSNRPGGLEGNIKEDLSSDGRTNAVVGGRKFREQTSSWLILAVIMIISALACLFIYRRK